MSVRHVLDMDDLGTDDVLAVLDRAEATRPVAAGPDGELSAGRLLAGRSVGLYFEKPSLRTRHSCEVAVVQLGGHPLTFRQDEVGTGSREPITDVARVLSGYHAALGARVFDHGVLEDVARVASVPVVNLLSDRSHPCQTLADLLTMRQEFGALDGLEAAWVGDFNNVARSLCVGASLTGVKMRVASPSGYGPTEEDLDRLRALGAAPLVTTRPEEAVSGARAVHTDVWASMGQESEAEARGRAFEGFTVDERLMAEAAGDAVFMHCLPAHRGEEVAAAVVDGPRSRAFGQAHNRLPAFRGLLAWLVATAGAGAGASGGGLAEEAR